MSRSSRMLLPNAELTRYDATREYRMIEPRSGVHFSIAVSDLHASQKFYTEILGLTLVQTAPANGMVFLRAGNDHVILAKSNAALQRDAKDSRPAHHAFKVDSEKYEDAKTFLASRGVEVFEEAKQATSRDRTSRSSTTGWRGSMRASRACSTT